MKLIIAGSRDFDGVVGFDKAVNLLMKFMKQLPYHPEEIVSGTAKGGDEVGEIWATRNNVQIKQFPDDWDQYKKAAGPIRNKQMAEYSDAAIVLWDGKSKGSKEYD